MQSNRQSSLENAPIMIELSHVSMRYRAPNDRMTNLKEYLISRVKGRVKHSYFQALEDLSLTVRQGEVLGLIGHNGAGKSTILKIVSGILKPTSGSVRVHGNVVPMLELGSGFDMDMTGHENIFLNGALLGYSEKYLKEKYDEIVAFSEIEPFIHVPLRNYSSGMIARLAFSVAAVVQPDILIVDEVLSVGDSDFQLKSRNRMMELMGGGTTVLFVSHNMEQIREICDRVVWIENGQIRMSGDTQAVCDSYIER